MIWRLALALALTAPPSAAPGADGVLYVRHAGVVLRSEPGLGGRAVGSVPARSRAVLLGARSEVEEIEGVTGRWAKVRVGDQVGWVFDRNLSFVRPPTAEQTRQALLKRLVRCDRAVLRLRPGGTGAAVAEPRSDPPAPTLRNLRWWGDGPFYVVFEVWSGRAEALEQEGLALCELEYDDAREQFDGREVDLRRRAPDTMSPLGLGSECRGAAGREEGCPALVAAVAQGRADEVGALLGRGVDPNATTRWGWTALHHAAWSGPAATARLLLERGAHRSAKGRDGCSPLHLAAGAGREETVSGLLQRKADVEDLDRDGRTALHWAADKGHARVAAALLGHGASADARDFHGWTALSYAARRGHLEALRALLVNGAGPNARDRDDATALHAAAAECQTGAVGLLLAHGADPALRDRYGLLPLHHAFFARCASVPAGLSTRE